MLQLTERPLGVESRTPPLLGHTPLGVCALLSGRPPAEAPSQLGPALPCPTSPTRGSSRRAVEFGKRSSFLLLSSDRFSRTQL